VWKAQTGGTPTASTPAPTPITTSEDNQQTAQDTLVSPPVSTTVTGKTLDITGEITSVGKHHLVNLVKTILARREYPFLTGSPGAGKTHLCMQMAEDMELPFVLISCSEDMLKSELSGSVSPLTGNVIHTAFRHAWENGGLILFDECGLAPGSFLNVLNSAMAQKKMLFPGQNAPTEIHPNCFMVFADNSTLYGNSSLFPERKDCGAAFRNRLTYVYFDYDLAVELSVITNIMDGDVKRAQTWHAGVKGLRAGLKAIASPVIASPRFAFAAAKWFMDGLEYDVVMSLSLYEGRDNDPDFEDIVKMAQPIVARFRMRY
jgi:hypothetical protein